MSKRKGSGSGDCFANARNDKVCEVRPILPVDYVHGQVQAAALVLDERIEKLGGHVFADLFRTVLFGMWITQMKPGEHPAGVDGWNGEVINLLSELMWGIEDLGGVRRTEEGGMV